ncbi:MAG TPA: MerR family transcriptional regulator [Opitutaceae bacterium]
MSNFIILTRHGNVPGRHGDGRSTYTLEAAAELADVHPELVRYYLSQGVFGPLAAGEGQTPLFDEDAVYELRRIEHFRRHYGVHRRALPLISRLLRDVARLEAELRFRREP